MLYIYIIFFIIIYIYIYRAPSKLLDDAAVWFTHQKKRPPKINRSLKKEESVLHVDSTAKEIRVEGKSPKTSRGPVPNTFQLYVILLPTKLPHHQYQENHINLGFGPSTVLTPLAPPSSRGERFPETCKGLKLGHVEAWHSAWCTAFSWRRRCLISKLDLTQNGSPTEI